MARIGIFSITCVDRSGEFYSIGRRQPKRCPYSVLQLEQTWPLTDDHRTPQPGLASVLCREYIGENYVSTAPALTILSRGPIGGG